MSKIEKLSEEQVFKQELADDELVAITGGDTENDDEEDQNNCLLYLWRNILRGGFPNCAATVEEDSWCDTNDACFSQSVDYESMKRCQKAWQ